MSFSINSCQIPYLRKVDALEPRNMTLRKYYVLQVFNEAIICAFFGMTVENRPQRLVGYGFLSEQQGFPQNSRKFTGWAILTLNFLESCPRVDILKY